MGRGHLFGLIFGGWAFGPFRLYIIDTDFVVGSSGHHWRLALDPWLDRFPNRILIQLLNFLPMVNGNTLEHLHLIFQSLELQIFLIDLRVQKFNFLRIMLLHGDIVFFHLVNFVA